MLPLSNVKDIQYKSDKKIGHLRGIYPIFEEFLVKKQNIS